ncbi:MAG: leucine-rich repeat domain-containing protein [Oscillospiraceae bacterium]|nr:leucine-rich repeat domain-containing protein [Oscillospiraceae bacterium]
MKRKNILKSVTAAAMTTALFCLQTPIFADDYEEQQNYYDGFTYEEWNSIILGYGYYYADDEYEVKYEKSHTNDIDSTAWIMDYTESIDGYTVMFSSNFRSCQELKIKVPDSFGPENKGYEPIYVKCIKGSCSFKEFDLNPENKYMTLVDNVVFSKDKKTLMSYAQNDERTAYEIPNGTEIIGSSAFHSCNNITEILIPDSVKSIQDGAFWHMESLKEVSIPPLVEELEQSTFLNCKNLEEVNIPENSKLKKIGVAAFKETKISELTLPSFEIEIEKTAFVACNEKNSITLKSYVKPEVKATYSSKTDTYKLKWEKVTNAARYEVYQKKSDGSYKLVGKTTGDSIKLNGVKAGKKYTFTVKPIAEIEATGDEGQYSFYDLPEYYIIEGTMSDDVTFVG